MAKERQHVEGGASKTYDLYQDCQLFDTTKDAENTKALIYNHQFGRLGHYNGWPVMLGGASSEDAMYNGEMIVERIDEDYVDDYNAIGWSVEESLEMKM